MKKRNTKQRQVIRKVIETEARPLTVGEVLELSQIDLPSLGQATVYRALKDLVTEGWLEAISVAGTSRYERADQGHHHHFHCHSCDKTFDIPGCIGDLKSLVPEAFKILAHELTIFGMCRTCNGGVSL